jgi:hypothetical protein
MRTNHVVNYETVKELAKEQGCSVNDLIVLAPQNDPFYVGTKSDVDKAHWFADIWQRFGYSNGVHLRRVHYQLVSQSTPVILPNGLPYENTEGCWQYMNNASKYARYLGLVDPGAFVDRRNPTPHLFLPDSYSDPSISVDGNFYGFDLALPEFPSMPDYYLSGYEGEQRYHVEIWAEKTTQDDILLPLCQRYGVNLITGAGELSITATVKLLTERMREDKPLRILYVSDFDPAGLTMPVSVARKLEFFIRESGVSSDVQLHPIVLTPEQVRKYRLPRTPIKDSELRKGRFEETYGAGATELDALEALRPGELARIVAAEIERFYDKSLDQRVYREKSRIWQLLREQRDAVLEQYSEELETLRSEYEGIRAEFQERIASHQERLEALKEAIEIDLESQMPDLTDYPIPPAMDGNEYREPLFDSFRDYVDQLTVYKEFQNKVTR